MAEGFHFLRPLWLLALPAAAALVYVLHRMGDPRSGWRGVLDPHLLDALLVRHEGRRRIGPVHLLSVGWLLAIVALAGPSWRREPAPFAEDTAALVVVMKVTPSMTAKDVQPSRLARASQKVRDLLAQRSDVECALFAYAGSAHRVMPLTKDGELIATFAASLSPEIMPVPQGDTAADAIALANAELRRARRSGSIVLLADGVGSAQLDEVAASVPVHVLAMGAPPERAFAGAPPPDFDSLRRLAKKTGGSYTLVAPDASDVERVAESAERKIGTTAGDDEGARWKDDGYWLVPFVALVALFWSRRGWVIGVSGGAR